MLWNPRDKYPKIMTLVQVAVSDLAGLAGHVGHVGHVGDLSFRYLVTKLNRLI